MFVTECKSKSFCSLKSTTAAPHRTLMLVFTGDFELLFRIRKGAAYLFEGELDGLVLAQLQDVHQLHDGFVAAVQLILPLDELLFLLRKVDKLVQGLLVDMTVLLQLCVALFQLAEQLQEKEREGFKE